MKHYNSDLCFHIRLRLELLKISLAKFQEMHIILFYVGVFVSILHHTIKSSFTFFRNMIIFEPQLTRKRHIYYETYG